ncbi:MAG: FecR domain-containing protein [Thermodesulfovibrionales bacterium]
MDTRIKRFGVVLSFVLALAFLLNGKMAFPLDPSINVLGDLAGSGKAEMKVLDRWVSVTDKTFPLVDGASLRSGDGRMSIILRDGARMEIGENSACEISGSKGDYSVRLRTGNVGFTVPKGISFAVATSKSQILARPAEMLQKVKYENEGTVQGVISYDGKGTKVTSVSGTLVVKNAGGSETEMVTTGKAVYIADNESGKSATPASSSGGTNPGATDPAAATWVVPTVTAAGIGGMTAIGISNNNSDHSHVPPVVSPSKP